MKLTRNIIGKDNMEYWAKARETARKVSSWPKWKKEVKLGSARIHEPHKKESL